MISLVSRALFLPFAIRTSRKKSLFVSTYFTNLYTEQIQITRSFHKTLRLNQDSPIDSNSSDSEDTDIMDLKKVLKKLRALAPTTLAADWDNVGLLIEPSPPHIVTSILLTNDLTMPVLEEAIEKKVSLILSYHPPIFVPLKRLTQRSWKELITLKCIENRIAVYSPHTACDSVQGGVNDWLLQPFSGRTEVIEKSYDTQFPMGGGFRLEFTLSGEMESKQQQQMENAVCKTTGVSLIAKHSLDSGGIRFCLNCTEKAVPRVMECLQANPDTRSTVEIFKSEKPPIPSHGQGRVCKLSSPVSLQEAVDSVKKHLKLTHIRLAPAVGATLESRLKSVAVCAGSGSSVLRGVEADLYISGEMSHHDVLDANHHGVSVILCDHSNTERGYLSVMRERLTADLEGEVEVMLSDKDRDPLTII